MQPPHTRLPLWHSLLYSTGILLPVGGVPAGIAAGILFPAQYQMSPSDAWQLGGIMIGASLLLGASSLLAARIFTKRRRRLRVIGR